MVIIEQLVAKINSFLWDYTLIIFLCGTGLYLTIRLRFIQVKEFMYSITHAFTSASLKGEAADEHGMSSFQSLVTSIAGQVGTGNLAGTATALVSGGPGAIFWLWVSAFFGMATIFSEATLAQQFKRYKDGQIIGGPAYYIKAAYKGKLGKMVQSNSIDAAFANSIPVNETIIGIITASISGFIFLGGIKRIASITEKVVPIMGILYISGALMFLIFNINEVPHAFYMIFVSAFNPKAIIGGSLGIGIQQAMRFGVARGLFSNEAGMGSTPHAHAIAKVEHPCEQGAVAMMGVFATFIVITLTSLVILTSGLLQDNVYNLSSPSLISETYKGISLTQEAFKTRFGDIGVLFIAVCLLFFAFSTIIAWYFFGEQNIRYLFGQKMSKVYGVIVVIFIFIGSTLKVDLVWALADCFNGLMVIPNLLGILALSPLISKLTKDYNKFKKRKTENKLEK